MYLSVRDEGRFGDSSDGGRGTVVVAKGRLPFSELSLGRGDRFRKHSTDVVELRGRRGLQGVEHARLLLVYELGEPMQCSVCRRNGGRSLCGRLLAILSRPLWENLAGRLTRRPGQVACLLRIRVRSKSQHRRRVSRQLSGERTRRLSRLPRAPK
jgi:hypothetical protein